MAIFSKEAAKKRMSGAFGLRSRPREHYDKTSCHRIVAQRTWQAAIPGAENRAGKEPWSQGEHLAYAAYGYVVQTIQLVQVEAGYVAHVHVRGCTNTPLHPLRRPSPHSEVTDDSFFALRS